MLEDDVTLSPAEYIAQNVFRCWTTELSNIISHNNQHEYVGDSIASIYNDFPVIETLLLSGHPLCAGFHQLTIRYLDSLRYLLAEHNKHHDLFWRKDMDLLTSQDIEKHADIFNNYFLTRSERKFIDDVINKFDSLFDFTELPT